jgi:hypothetical protein
MSKQLKFDFWKRRKKTMSEDAKIVLENNKKVWRAEAIKMLIGFAKEFSPKTIIEFERASGFKLNELLGGQDD